jgi:hypothetical protein
LSHEFYTLRERFNNELRFFLTAAGKAGLFSKPVSVSSDKFRYLDAPLTGRIINSTRDL